MSKFFLFPQDVSSIVTVKKNGNETFHYPYIVEKPSSFFNHEFNIETHRVLTEIGVYREHPKLKRFVDRLNPGKWGPLIFPNASREHQLTLTWSVVFFFIYDDVLEDHAEHEIDKMLAASVGDLIDWQNEPRSLVRAMAKLVGEGFKSMSHNLKQRWLFAIGKYIESIGTETALLNDMKTNGKHPDCDTFLNWRWYNVAGLAAVLILESQLVNENLPEDFVHGDLYQQAIIQFNILFIIQNDYVSAVCGRDEGRLNMSYALSCKFGYDHDRSLCVMMTMHDQAMQVLNNIYIQIATTYKNNMEVIKWIECMQLGSFGFARFWEGSARYDENEQETY